MMSEVDIEILWVGLKKVDADWNQDPAWKRALMLHSIHRGSRALFPLKEKRNVARFGGEIVQEHLTKRKGTADDDEIGFFRF